VCGEREREREREIKEKRKREGGGQDWELNHPIMHDTDIHIIF
jgi:hypothetical protein